jgi:hypothetical protein
MFANLTPPNLTPPNLTPGEYAVLLRQDFAAFAGAASTTSIRRPSSRSTGT